MLILNLIIALNISYRGIVTFLEDDYRFYDRLLYRLYLKSNLGQGKIKFHLVLIAYDDDYLTYTSFQTGGLINNRYDQDAQGRDKKPVNRKR
jgi:hypothetical protein